MIREFETYPDYEWLDGKMVTHWHSKASVNSRFVACVSPLYPESSRVTLAGGYNFDVNAPYDDVVAWWIDGVEK
jgi:hypothetical protein